MVNEIKLSMIVEFWSAGICNQIQVKALKTKFCKGKNLKQDKLSLSRYT